MLSFGFSSSRLIILLHRFVVVAVERPDDCSCQILLYC